MFTNKDYQEEKEKILSFIGRQALKKSYPAKYLEDISKITEKMFSFLNIESENDINNERINQAISIAKKYHEGQERKYTEQEYVKHLFEVGKLLSNYVKDEDIVITGILHDILEKTEVKKEEIELIFGNKIIRYLDYLTDKEKEGNKETRFNKNWESFIKCPKEVVVIKLLDVMSNTRSTMLCNARYGEEYLKPIVEIINPYFLNCEFLNKDLKEKFNEMTKLCEEIIKIQKNNKIDKLEKTYRNKQKLIKKELRKEIKI